MTAPKLVFGAYNDLFNTDDCPAKDIMELLDSAGIKVFDTARMYGSSEELIGKNSVGERFIVDTKHPGGLAPGGATRQSILDLAKTSFEFLKMDQVDVYYLHSPDPATPIAVTLQALNDLYKQGRFKRLGLSNFSAEQVEEVVRVATENSFVVPSVYQGNYSAVWRKQETQLFPTLRKHNIAFYAYSPLAGGFLAKSRAQLTQGSGRFVDDGGFVNSLYRLMFMRPWYLDFIEKWGGISDRTGISKAEMAMRWIVYHSALDAEHGDGVIIGANSMDQLRSTIAGLRKGPLPDDIAKQIEAAWEDIKESALGEAVPTVVDFANEMQSRGTQGQ
ncbi:NADP-dependent oxidoreductase domain-containing protein [Cladochytrium replicatum]|nr:NADP-dependent oxidoreductase domain-containing protein [Cladochytrium replicatum]